MKSSQTIKTAEALTGTTTTQATSYVRDSAVLRQIYLSRLAKRRGYQSDEQSWMFSLELFSALGHYEL